MTVSWIIFINSIPEIKIINVLHEFLPSLFQMLSEKNKELNNLAEKCLKDLIKEIESFFETLSYEVEVKILEILIDQCKSTNEQILLTAFEWINLFMTKYKYYLIQNKKSTISPYTKSLITTNKNSSFNFNKMQFNYNSSSYTQLNNFNNTQEQQLFENNKSDESGLNFNTLSVSENERKIPFNLFSKILEIILNSINNQKTEIKKSSNEMNANLLTIVEFYGESYNANIKLFEEVLKNYFSVEEKESNLHTLEIVLNWINKLFKKFHEEMFSKVDDFVESITNILTYQNENLFNSVLDIICDIAKYRDENIEIILSIILKRLRANKNLLKNKTLTILKKFCNILQVDRVYSTFADVLIKIDDIEFVGRMIDILDLFLVTAKETEPLRYLVRNIRKNNDPAEKQFFEKLFKTWCINPVSTVILCLVAEYYELSNYLLIQLY
jgi:vacuole morphology and inheritance protein 14